MGGVGVMCGHKAFMLLFSHFPCDAGGRTEEQIRAPQLTLGFILVSDFTGLLSDL